MSGKIKPPARTVNVAVVGLGFMGVTHLQAYQKLRHVRIVAVGHATRPPVNGLIGGVKGNIQNSAAVQLSSKVKAYTDFSALLADPAVEAVDICTPTALHPAQVIAALAAGKYVLCEKPLAQSSASAKKVLAAAQASKKFLMPAMCMRFWPGWAWLKNVVTQQPYGPILAANFRRVSAKPAWGKNGVHAGGALFDLHIHDTDFVNFLFGKPAAVFSTGVLDAHGNADHVVTQYQFPNGPAVHAEGSWLLTQGFNMSYTLHCERATLDFDLSRGTAALQVAETGKKIRTVKLPATDGYHEEIRYFVDCVRRGEPPVTVTAADCVTALTICEAEEKSVRTGRLVKL
jgi:predicted dehydrogenase